MPRQHLINKYLLEQTGFEGNLSKFSKVCFSCYKCQLQILKETSLSSTDPDLTQLITSLKGKHSVIKSVQDVTDTAMPHTSIFVAELLLQGESLLLPTAHAFFDKIAQELMSKHDLSDDDTNVSVAYRWILSNLTSSLGHHLSCACKIRKHGTIIYRSNSDLLLALSKALHKHQMNTSEEISGIPNVSDESRCNDNILDEVFSCIDTQVFTGGQVSPFSI